MAKKIQFDIEAREGLKKGVDALANASNYGLDGTRAEERK